MKFLILQHTTDKKHLWIGAARKKKELKNPTKGAPVDNNWDSCVVKVSVNAQSLQELADRLQNLRFSGVAKEVSSFDK